ncbi:MAG: hypothetical protein ACM3YN_09545 [Parcubacteria group bacterium]
MTDADRDRSVPPRDAPPRGGTAKKIPPLVWIVLALLVGMAIWGAVQYGGSHRTPSGGSTPQAIQAPTVMPATNEPATNEPQNTMPPVNSAG